jgi:predicted Rossmann-fold nucleotide-binding protein
MTTTAQASFEDLKSTFEDYRTKAGSPSYIACFGKTFLEPENETYKLSQRVAEVIVQNGFGVLHGGYIGAMEAVSSGANTAIKKDASKNEYWNIGVPMYLFEKELKHSSSVRLPAAGDIFDRKEALVTFCDACVVLPSGGFGTLLEVLEIFHSNQMAEKFGGKIRPLFLVGNNWKTLFEAIGTHLDMNNQSSGEAFTHFLTSVEELDLELKLLRTNL